MTTETIRLRMVLLEVCFGPESSAPALLAYDRQDLETRQNERHEMLRAEMGHSFDDLKQTFRDSQTELLKAFYSYRESTDLKLRDSEISDSLLRQRMTALENRQGALEKRIDFERRIELPPAPPTP